MSVDSAAVFGDGRPRLSRFDRPALSLNELLKADGGDFVHFSVWTLLGRRAQLPEYQALLAILAAQGKPAVLARLKQWQSPGAELPDLEGLARLLRIQRRAAVPLVGPLILWLTSFLDQRPWLMVPAHVLTKVPRWLAWLRRRVSRLFNRIATLFRVPRPRQIRRHFGGGHAAPHPRLSPRAAELYLLLRSAVDRSGDAA